MRAFKLFTSVLAIFVAARADEDMEIINLDAPSMTSTEVPKEMVDYPEPEMPENPYGKITLDDIIRTGTLDGVNPPKNKEEQEVLDAFINFHTYTEASKSIDDSFENLIESLKMDDLNDMMKKVQEEMEAEFMVNEMAKLDLNPADISSLTEKQRENIDLALKRLDDMGQ